MYIKDGYYISCTKHIYVGVYIYVFIVQYIDICLYTLYKYRACADDGSVATCGGGTQVQ